MKPILSWTLTVVLATSLFTIDSCSFLKPGARIDGADIRIEFDTSLHSRVVAKIGGEKIVVGDFSPSEFVTVAGEDVTDFTLKSQKKEKIQDDIGRGIRITVTGEKTSLRKEISMCVYEEFPSMVVFQVSYANIGTDDVTVERWTNNRYRIAVKDTSGDDPPFWSYQSGSYRNRPDWVLPLMPGFAQKNWMGMNATDYGGGTPVSDVWRKDVGIGVGHVETVPKLVSLPVEMPDSTSALLGVTCEANRVLKSGEILTTLRTFVAVHKGDYFHTLDQYRHFMAKQGINIPKPPETAYEPIWCGWGYGRNFTSKQIYDALPKVKELGFKWAVLDDGWQTSEGDWYLVKDKYPNGDRDMVKLVQTIREMGLRPKLWWAPLAVDPGTDLIEQHPDYLLLNADSSYQRISWWNAYYLCPAYPPVQRYTKELVEKIMRTWDYDGLKIDGQHLNAAPPCYSKAHNHVYPEEAFEKIPEFFKVIYETAKSIKPDAVVEICPCGTAYSFFTMPFMNQPVSSDPTSSWQIRSKGKTFKALMGPDAAYYGDHVELSDRGMDFASTVGIGGVIGTKFTWPVGSGPQPRRRRGRSNDLTPEKEQVWKKWVNIYEDKMLPTGIYLGRLYDIGFDRPEAHAIRKNDALYYAFYADSFNGQLELRGLENQTYSVLDYENDRALGTVKGPRAELTVQFEDHLLLEAKPD